MRRASGVLLPISSLPNQQGIGTFGQSAYDFVDFLASTHQKYWQILPLTTTSYGDSPYQSFSAVAGNTHFIDFELLAQENLLAAEDYENVDFGDDLEQVNYALIYQNRRPILEKAVACFLAQDTAYEQLSQFEATATWLQDFAEFMAIKESFHQLALQDWPDKAIIQRNPEALEQKRASLQTEILYHKVTQYFFHKQWSALKHYANAKHIEIIGDMPIYVSADSVEVWTKPQLFKLDTNRKPLFVAGVPADGFSDDGQLWGNPVYDWPQHEQEGYSWWIERIRESFKQYDMLRIDHFKGFSDYWEIPAGSATANAGSWQTGPGYALFEKIHEALGDLPIIAENLGYIDDKAQTLLTATHFPGMKVLQFGLSNPNDDSFDLPHHYIENSIAYTGTHDNPVIKGWYETLSDDQRDFADSYTHRHKDESINRAMLRSLYASVSTLVICCMQDLLEKPANCRMNQPSTIGDNWTWRMLTEDLTDEKTRFLSDLTHLYRRY